MNEIEITIYTDGSSLGNPGPGGWGAVFVLPEGKVKELGGSEAQTTNNKMELTAVLRTLEELQKISGDTPAEVIMDSKYVLQGVETWMYGWEQNGWVTKGKTEVKSRDLWEAVLKNVREVKKSREVSFKHIPGHASHAGNERTDDIARGFAEGGGVKLFDGPLDDSPLAGADLSLNYDELKKQKAKKSRSGKAYSYLSLVDGKLEKHKTWPECEARVKGTKGAKFKKALSKEDEKEIVKEWGLV